MPTIAVMIPCLNEQITVGKVVADFRAALPQASIHIFDNRSTDRTAERARSRRARALRPAPRERACRARDVTVNRRSRELNVLLVDRLLYRKPAASLENREARI